MPLPLRVAYLYLRLVYEPGWSHVRHFAGHEITPRPPNLISVYIPIYIQQDATLHSLFYLETSLRVSGGISTHQQEHKQLYLQHLVFVTL